MYLTACEGCNLNKSFIFDTAVKIVVHISQLKRAVFSEVCYLERFQKAKVTCKVTQGHCYWRHSIGHICLPIGLPLYCLSLAPFPMILSFIYQDLKRSRDPEHTSFDVSSSMHVYANIPINQRTKFEVFSFCRSKDMKEDPKIKIMDDLGWLRLLKVIGNVTIQSNVHGCLS